MPRPTRVTIFFILPVILLAIFIGSCLARQGYVSNNLGKKQDGVVTTVPDSGKLSVNLTEEERSWLKQHPVIRVAQDPGWAPVEFSDKFGEPSGISDDYLRLIEECLGIKFKRIRNLTWQEAYARLQRWDLDMTTCVAETPRRKEFWTFTAPYISIPLVIFTRADVIYINDISELTGKKIAVVDGYVASEWIPVDFPGVHLVKVKSVKDGLILLKQGKVFAFIDNILVINYYRNKLRISGLKLAGVTPYVNAQRMAVRKDWAVLAGILQKALDVIPDSLRYNIYKKWVPARYQLSFDYVVIIEILAVLIVFFGILIFWNQQLAGEIKRRKRIESSLRETRSLYRLLFEYSPDGIVVIDPVTARITEFNDAACRQIGYSRQEFMGMSIFDFEETENPGKIREHIARVMQKGRAAFETQHRHRDGQIKDIYVIGQSVEISGKQVYHCVWHDITERKRSEEALRQSEVMLRIAGRMSRLGGWSVDFSTNKVIWSDEVAKIHEMPLGYSPSVEDGIGFYAPEWKEKIKTVFNACAEKGIPYDEEMEIITSQGRRVWVRTIGEAIRDAAGKIVKVQGAFQDITERKKVENERNKYLQEMEVFYKSSLGREERIIELKSEIERLKKELEK